MQQIVAERLLGTGCSAWSCSGLTCGPQGGVLPVCAAVAERSSAGTGVAWASKFPFTCFCVSSNFWFFLFNCDVNLWKELYLNFSATEWFLLCSESEMAVYKKWHEHLMARSKGSLLQCTEACLCCWENWIIFSYHRPGLFRRGQKRWNDYMCFSNTNLANPRDKRSVFPSISKSLNIYNLKMANE